MMTIFFTVFMAEIGDKTQLATMLFAADSKINKLDVFIASASALVIASAIGVIVGGFLTYFIPEKYLNYIAGIGFIIIGIWTIYKASPGC